MKILFFLLLIWALLPCPALAEDKTAATIAQATAGPAETEKNEALLPAGKNKAVQENKLSGGKEEKKGLKAGEKPEAGSVHRVEFVITGTECPVCLERMSGKMRKVPGVLKAAIFRFSVTNFGAVIYDAKRAQVNDLVQSVADEHVSFESVKDVLLSGEEIKRFIDPVNSSK